MVFVVDKVALGLVFLPVLQFPLSVSFHLRSYSFYYYSYQKDKRAKRWTTDQSNARSNIRKHCKEKFLQNLWELSLWHRFEAKETINYPTAISP
jgi:hypothetical protein